MVYFAIGETDLTVYIDTQEYEMNRADVYQEWVDGNWTNRRQIVRQQITGKITAGFKSAASFAAFNALLTDEIAENGYYEVTAYVQNTGTTETFYAFVSTSATAKWDTKNGREWHEVVITITER